MPVKTLLRPGGATIYVRGTVGGVRIFESTGTSDPKKAEAYRSKREAELWERSVYGAKAVITFAEAVEAYAREHPRSERDKPRLDKLLLHFGAKKLHEIGQDELPRAYRACLQDGMNASPAAKLRGVVAPLRAVLEFAATNRWCERPAFRAPKQTKVITGFLRPMEATALVQAAAMHLRPLLVFLLGTGCRLSEALELQWKDLDLRGARAVVLQKQGDQRDVDLPPVVVAALAALPDRNGAVFRPQRRGPSPRDPRLAESYADNGRSYGGQIKTAWATACRKAGLPGHWHEWIDGKGRPQKVWRSDFTPHDCRHTWATWHYCVHRDLLRLKGDGGWSTVSMVERYAKKMPDAYRDEAVAWWSGGAVLVQDTSLTA